MRRIFSIFCSCMRYSSSSASADVRAGALAPLFLAPPFAPFPPLIASFLFVFLSRCLRLLLLFACGEKKRPSNQRFYCRGEENPGKRCFSLASPPSMMMMMIMIQFVGKSRHKSCSHFFASISCAVQSCIMQSKLGTCCV